MPLALNWKLRVFVEEPSQTIVDHGRPSGCTPK